MKTRRILMGALALTVVAATFFACNKENPVANNLPSDRRLLAVRDASGNIINTMSPEEVTKQVNVGMKSTQYVIESYSITEPDDNQPYKALTVSLMEVETGEAVSFALFGDYVEEIEGHFYLSSETARGNVEFRTTDSIVGKLVNFVEQPVDPTYQPPGGCGFLVTCRQKNCANDTCKPIWFNCSACTPNEQSNANNTECYVSGQGWGWWLLEVVIKAIGLVPSAQQ